jgi:hypothetical protein
LLGVGLSLILHSITLNALVALIAIAANLCLRLTEKWREMGGVAERWKGFATDATASLTLVLIVVGTLIALPAVTHSASSQHRTEPAILVQIRCKPGTADLWRDDFEQHIRPAIEEAISHDDGFTDFQFLQAALPGQGFDFALLYSGKTYASLDQPRIPPQYVAMMQREGAMRTLATAREMGTWEDHVTVSLVHLSRTR